MVTKTARDIESAVKESLGEVAPEIDPESLDPAVNFREQFEFDSIDYLNFALGLEERLDVEIPETDYPKLSSIDGCVRYLRSIDEG